MFRHDEKNSELICQVMERYNEDFDNGQISRLGLLMDLHMASFATCMDWAALLRSDDLTFVHDIGGIYAHLNRETGILEGRFVPRCAA